MVTTINYKKGPPKGTVNNPRGKNQYSGKASDVQARVAKPGMSLGQRFMKGVENLTPTGKAVVKGNAASVTKGATAVNKAVVNAPVVRATVAKANKNADKFNKNMSAAGNKALDTAFKGVVNTVDTAAAAKKQAELANKNLTNSKLNKDATTAVKRATGLKAEVELAGRNLRNSKLGKQVEKEAGIAGTNVKAWFKKRMQRVRNQGD
jgi:hypothetical protein